ncbi:hypothetical protein DZ860_16595 [Vibrio sinensis]|uniref:Uncharacterized protein n=1 Tax=Vibrio sinensis TaxID=2302434 RepID=A0A3A6QZD3_9VIBR|nr:hypothetical protein [Vibrio sinensis]RJX68615.1 hypothetical protein DZ860_16595 [Vibrio sinensis]
MIWFGIKRIGVIFTGLIIFIVAVFFGAGIGNDLHSQPFIRISGAKPDDATVKAWANYGVKGDECESYSYDLFGRKAFRGGKSTVFFPKNHADDVNQFEIRIPYKTYTNSDNCIVELRDVTVEAYNLFDTVGFAQLRIAKADNTYRKGTIELKEQITAKNCNGKLYQWSKNIWKGIIGCQYFVSEKQISKKSETNAKSVYFDFSQFNDETIINYDILAGENYRSTPLDPQTGE